MTITMINNLMITLIQGSKTDPPLWLHRSDSHRQHNPTLIIPYTVITYQDDDGDGGDGGDDDGDGDGDSEEKTKIGDHAEFLQKLFEPDWVALPFAKPCSQLEEPSSKILSRNFC